MSHYERHVFFCLNQRTNGKKCCYDADSPTMCAYAKAAVKAHPALENVRVNQAGCLGRCELGPTIVIYPDGVWYTYHSQADVDEIIEKHLVEGQIVDRLLIDKV